MFGSAQGFRGGSGYLLDTLALRPERNGFSFIAHRPDRFCWSTPRRPRNWRAIPKPSALNWLLEEASTSINTAAARSNASLMAIG